MLVGDKKCGYQVQVSAGRGDSGHRGGGSQGQHLEVELDWGAGVLG